MPIWHLFFLLIHHSMFSVSKNPTIKEIQGLYKDKKATPTQVIHFFLNRSKQVDKEIKSVLRYTERLAAEEAVNCDEILNQYEQERGDSWFEDLICDYPLFGVPYCLKDNILIEGEISTSASKILEDYKAPYSATVYLRLKAAGAVVIAQTNQDEFAVGSSTENSAYQITHNPYSLDRVPGGSSGGPAACVASGQSVFGLGSDTGGSIRLPATFCNLVGAKTTYGSVSRYGVMALASSLDQVGPFSNSVEDNLLVLQVLSGKDPHDNTSVDITELKTKIAKLITYIDTKKTHNRKSIKSDQPIKIGLIKELLGEGVDPIIRTKIKELANNLEAYGHQIVELELPLTKYALAIYYTIMTVETASNLERYDAVRFAAKVLEDSKNPELFFTAREKGFGDEPKRRIMLGTYASSSGFYDAYYSRAEKVMILLRQQFQEAFNKVDLILTPTSPEFPFKIGEKSDNPLSMYLSDIMTISINLTRISAINIPLGLFNYTEKPKTLDSLNPNKTKPVEIKLPIGCQVLGPEFSEDKVYKLAFEIEKLIKNTK